MRIIHTSDWHLGRQFLGQKLDDDHAVILDQVLEAVIEYRPDAMIIAGDIFDRAAPPATAVAQFNDFICRFRERSSAALIVIAGNHDSADRIDAYSVSADPSRIMIRGPIRLEEKPIVLSDDHGEVAFTGLPFGSEYAARSVFDTTEITSPEEVLKAQVDAARNYVPDGARWVIAAHAFVTGATQTDSERKIVVGGVETVGASVFEGASYVALGHLHRPQSAGSDHIVYSGSPLGFGFDEADAEKSLSLVEIDGNGAVALERIPLKPRRRIRVVNGEFQAILEAARQLPSDDFIKLVVSDEGALLDPMSRIREFYPNALQLQYARELRDAPKLEGDLPNLELDDPETVISGFLSEVRDEKPSEEEMAFVSKKLTELQEDEASS